ncbi:MAG: anion transporter [Proteobacteria bacterium]|nr:anion transporter [Pseudomonadota bacterium]
MNLSILAVFVFVYLGLALGRFPGLALDRTGVALLGMIAILALSGAGVSELNAAVDLPTIILLFGLMVVSAQFRLGGFYSRIVRRAAAVRTSPPVLLAVLIAVVGLLSALLANDIVCLAATPVLVEACAVRRLDPKPFLLALACAANIGSAATLIGNPQNMLIGQVLHLSFSGYLGQALAPSLVSLVLAWGIIALLYKGRWARDTQVPPSFSPDFNLWQTGKGLVVLCGLVTAFLFAPWPREIVALIGAGLLLCSRRMRSREMLGLVDWHLLLLFAALFTVNHALKGTGYLNQIAAALESVSIRLDEPAWLFAVCVPLSNLVSNVPAVMLLLPYAVHPDAGAALALSSTLAGNLLVVGSIANIIVLEQAAGMGVRISWAEHARVGVPVTLASLLAAGLWLWILP